MELIRKITNEQKDKALGHLFPSLLPFHNFDFVSPIHQFFSVFQLLSVFDNFSSHLYIFYFTFYILTCWDISNSTFKQQSIWFDFELSFGSTLLILFFLAWVKDDPGPSMFFFLSSYFHDFTVTWFLPDFFLQFCSTVKLLW